MGIHNFNSICLITECNGCGTKEKPFCIGEPAGT